MNRQQNISAASGSCIPLLLIQLSFWVWLLFSKLTTAIYKPHWWYVFVRASCWRETLNKQRDTSYCSLTLATASAQTIHKTIKQTKDLCLAIKHTHTSLCFTSPWLGQQIFLCKTIETQAELASSCCCSNTPLRLHPAVWTAWLPDMFSSARWLEWLTWDALLCRGFVASLHHWQCNNKVSGRSLFGVSHLGGKCDEATQRAQS